MRNDLSDSSRVWIYQAERSLTPEEINYINERLTRFCISWTAHDQALKAGFDVLYKRFILLSVDETATGASGCSIDKSTRELKDISLHLDIDFFNRMNLVYLKDEQVLTVPLNETEQLKAQGEISEDTLFFNTLVKDLGDLKRQFLIPYKQHWINRTSK